MRSAMKAGGVVVFLLLSGCAHIDFGGDGMTYFDPEPYLFVSTKSDCITTATVLVMPGARKSMKFVSGYGAADLSAKLTNGMIESVNQKTDTKIPETITTLTGLGKVAAELKTLEKPITCVPAAALYPVIDGRPDLAHPILFPVAREK
ncbi:MAG: hypothetical protein OHK006_16450 [Thermodesulfovibrionales bacterium]